MKIKKSTLFDVEFLPRCKSIIKKLAETLGVRYDKPEYFLQIIHKGDVDVVEEIKKIILKICAL